MVQEHLNFILEEQRRKAHIWEADEHRRLKQLREERGAGSYVPVWKRVMRLKHLKQLTRQLTQRESAPVQARISPNKNSCPCCDAAVGESI